MNDIRIKEYVDDIFKETVASEKVLEQKEELVVNLTERVRDYMKEGLSFDAAFDTAKNSIGDTEELTAPFEKIDLRQNPPQTVADESRPNFRIALPLQSWQLAAMSPFIYLSLGFLFGWWAWAWVIIPIAGIFCAPMPFWTRMVALSPFIYLTLGFLLGWWAWAWIIIPVSGILVAQKA